MHADVILHKIKETAKTSPPYNSVIFRESCNDRLMAILKFASSIVPITVGSCQVMGHNREKAYCIII